MPHTVLFQTLCLTGKFSGPPAILPVGPTGLLGVWLDVCGPYCHTEQVSCDSSSAKMSENQDTHVEATHITLHHRKLRFKVVPGHTASQQQSQAQSGAPFQ